MRKSGWVLPTISAFIRTQRLNNNQAIKKLWLESLCAANYPPSTFYKGPVMPAAGVLRMVDAGALPWLTSLWLSGPGKPLNDCRWSGSYTLNHLWFVFRPSWVHSFSNVILPTKLYALFSYNASCAILRRFTAVWSVTTTSSCSILKSSVWESLKAIRLHSNTSACSIICVGFMIHQQVTKL